MSDRFRRTDLAPPKKLQEKGENRSAFFTIFFTAYKVEKWGLNNLFHLNFFLYENENKVHNQRKPLQLQKFSETPPKNYPFKIFVENFSNLRHLYC